MKDFSLYKPMLLREMKKPFDSEEYIFEPKYDGVRALVFVSSGEIIIKSRNGKILNDKFPELLGIKNISRCDVIFDGEIVLFDASIPSFSALQNRIMLKDNKKIDFFSKNNPVVFVCFDILYEGKDLTSLKLIDRKKILEKYEDKYGFVKTIYVEGSGIKLFDSAKSMGLEGIVCKKIDSKYLVGKRSDEWLKVKNITDSEFYIGGYFDNEKSYMATLVVGEVVNGKLYYSAKVTINKKSLEYKLIKKQRRLNNSPFVDFDNVDYIYIKPSLICTVSYLEKTSNGHLRHALYKGLRFN